MAVATVDVLSVFTYLVLQLLKPAKTFVRRDAFCNNQRKVVATFEKLTQYGAWPTAPWAPSAKKPRIGQGQKITQGGQHLNIKGVNMKATQYTSVTKLVNRAAFVLALFTSTLATTTSLAAPLVFETEAAKIIVVRPIDAWFADTSQQEKSLSDHKSKKANYSIMQGKEWLIGYPSLFSSPTNHPIITDINKRLDLAGFERPRMLSNNFFSIQAPTSVPPIAIQDFLDYQSDVYQQMVMAQGNPDDLQSKNSRNKFIGAALAVSSTLLAGQRFGYDLGATTFLGSGSARDLYSAVSTYKSAMAAVELPSIDLTSFKEISIRRVIANPGQIIGQIIIAYKDEKTEAAEHEALVIAVVALTGANSTTAEIEQARKEDFARRKAIWDKCVADGGGTCKPEPIRRGGG